MRVTFLILLTLFNLINPKTIYARNEDPYWQIQSVDTMKLSRDLAREKMDDSEFEKIISREVKNISGVGATHVAIATPYDDEFIPFMKKWIKEARKDGLNVWFRGNFSGWEGWFGYHRISPEEHTNKIEDFILLNRDLFEDGDIFTPCTECENGGSGDPRDTGNIQGFRDFLISEYEISNRSFQMIGKDVKGGYFSMNADVAKLIMDKDTTKALGEIVVIDHYVEDPEQLSKDVAEIAEKSDGKVILGEIGVPIPDIHGYMTASQQADWVQKALSLLSSKQVLLGINYWVASGGTTSLWYDDASEKPSVEVIRNYFIPNELSGKVVDELGKSIKEAEVIAGAKNVNTNSEGVFRIDVVPSIEKLLIKNDDYEEKSVWLTDALPDKIILKRSDGNVFFKIKLSIYQAINKIKELL
ncbi:MAG: hypothetical protein UT19_C0004G0045 [Candidatus Woesebacteria bacterium GW2011_GWB1_39_10b]|uniref:Glycoside hydrolase family 5 domain-containing protein n=3 Tax=Candidatus Woeseibacteriota TaxID=1752722 RepID=A0A0G0NKH8_9BACT|nr:MAG: hypothetical protein US72_C0010G0021 [Microgenomates group bacterium GW2011_GWC1_38_12]KKQ94084.1 MAG: hypothetical protein UT19_C0004G0045 [Candidatus Woesebacteria bacterium GW2011_GWB1_39_10b]KKR13321.1 MAG: hypothetical protein UT40_C0019G0003 [Candidatus Woesebacteria bacterium GW2011_GWA1_39_21b]OGM63694.1 MAG: hypothetical protein A3A52_02630 [Candidatus Woesebacteria bacterium RIFCSPLOWO2_01_FULL_39_14]